jgi:hypothetical protein
MRIEKEPSANSNKVRNFLIGATGVLGGVLLINIWNDGYDTLREDEQTSREFKVEEAANQFIDVIQVVETGREGQTINAKILYGGEALRACNIHYDIHPQSNSTFDPETLDISSCFVD